MKRKRRGRKKDKRMLGLAIFFLLIGIGIFSILPASAYQMVPVAWTPYDSQMAPVRPILEGESGREQETTLSLSQVNSWMRQLRDIPYHYRRSWTGCYKVDERGEGDCKGKALALYRRMKEAGAANVYLVIGLKDAGNPETHVWLLWNRDGKTYNLDPTFQSRAFLKNEFGRSSYRPCYSYCGAEKFNVVPD